MSTATLSTESVPADRFVRTADPVARPVRFPGVVRSEWIKLGSVRSNVVTLVATTAVMIVVGLIFAGLLGGVFSGDGGDTSNEFADNPAGATLQGVFLAQLIIAVLGALITTSEYSTGMIRSTLAAVPKRLPVLWAKAIVVGAVTFTIMLLASLTAFFAGQWLIGTGDIAPASIGDPGVLRAIIGTAGYLAGIAVLGVAIGTLLRNTAATISTLVGLVFLLPGLGTVLLPADWQEGVLKFLPSSAQQSFASVVDVPGQLGAGAGFAVFAAWIVVLLGGAAVALKRRNV